MRKSVKQIVCILLVGCLLTSGSAFALGDTTEYTPDSVQYAHIDEVAAGITMSRLGKATCIGDVELTYSTDTAHLYTTLERYVGGTWTAVTTWSDTGSIYVAIDEDYYVTSGYYYRVYTQAYIYDSNNTFVEYASVASCTVYY